MGITAMIYGVYTQIVCGSACLLVLIVYILYLIRHYMDITRNHHPRSCNTMYLEPVYIPLHSQSAHPDLITSAFACTPVWVHVSRQSPPTPPNLRSCLSMFILVSKKLPWMLFRIPHYIIILTSPKYNLKLKPMDNQGRKNPKHNDADSIRE